MVAVSTSPSDNDQEYRLKIKAKVIHGLPGAARDLVVVTPDLMTKAKIMAVTLRQIAGRGVLSAFETRDVDAALDAFWVQFEAQVGGGEPKV